jgi:methyl acetate hydrolase
VRRICTMVASLLAFACTVGSAGPPALNPTGAAAISRMFQAAVDNGEIPGVVAAVTNRDRMLYLEAFGSQDAARGVPMSKDTVFRIASMTKPITSVAVMMLLEEGRLRLDDPAANYVPGLKGREVIASFNETDGSYTTRPAKQEMTVRHLLAHTAGLAYPFTSRTVVAIQEKTKREPRDQPLLFDPGSRWHYSPATAVLGDIVEKLSGESIENFDRKRIFRPLGMVDTSYRLPVEKAGRLSTVSRREESGLVETANAPTYTATVRGDGGLLSTASDYAAFLQMLLSEGRWHGTRLLRAESVRLMASNQIGSINVEEMPAVLPRISAAFPAGASKDKFGLGFQIAATDGAAIGERGAGSYTWGGINNTHFWVDPKNGVGVIYLTQVLPFYNRPSMDVMKRFEHLLYEHLQIR